MKAATVYFKACNEILTRKGFDVLPPACLTTFDTLLARLVGEKKQDAVCLAVEKLLKNFSPLPGEKYTSYLALTLVRSIWDVTREKKCSSHGDPFEDYTIQPNTVTVGVDFDLLHQELLAVSPHAPRFVELLAQGYNEKEILGNPPCNVPSMLPGWNKTPSAWRPSVDRDKTRKIRKVLAEHFGTTEV